MVWISLKINKDYLFSGIGLTKIGSVLAGFIVFLTGTYSFASSDWSKNQLHRLCENEELSSKLGDSHICPRIWLESFFVVIISSGFAVSMIFLACLAFTNSKAFRYKIIIITDMVYHGAYGVLIIVGGSLMIYSAAKIDQLIESGIIWTEPELKTLHFMNSEKILSGVLAVTTLPVICGIITLLLIQQYRLESLSFVQLIE